MATEIDHLVSKVNSSLLERGIKSDSSLSLGLKYLNTEETRTKDTLKPIDYTATLLYHNKECQRIRQEMNMNIEQLKKEMDEKIHSNSYYCFNELLSKFRNETHEQDNNLMIQMQQMWLKMNEMSNEINILKSKSNQFNFITNKIDSGAQDLKLRIESNTAKIEELIKTKDETKKTQDKLMIDMYPKIEILEHKVTDVIDRVVEIDKQQHDICLSINKINENSNVIDGNVKKLFLKTKDNYTEIRDLNSKISGSINEIGVLKSAYMSERNNKSKFIEPDTFNIFKKNIEIQLQSLKDSNEKGLKVIKEKQKDFNDKINYINQNACYKDDYSVIIKQQKQLNDKYDDDVKKLLKRIQANENNIKLLYNNMEELNKSNESLKKDIEDTFNNLNIWQNNFVSTVNKGLSQNTE